MKIKESKAAREKLIALGMVMSDDICRMAASLYEDGYMVTDVATCVVEMCVGYYNEYERAPRDDIETLATFKTDSPMVTDETKELTARFLKELQREYRATEHLNEDYIRDQMLLYFKERSLRIAIEKTQELLNRDSLEEAEAVMHGYNPVQVPSSSGVNPFTDVEDIQLALTQTYDPVITLDGPLGELLNLLLVRDAFVSFTGADKSGKTFWLMEMAWQALLAGHNVAFFEVGDLSKNQILQRFGVRMCGKPVHTFMCGKFRVPILDCLHNQTNQCRKSCRGACVEKGSPDYIPCNICQRNEPEAYSPAVWYREKEVDKPLTVSEWVKKAERFQGRTAKGIRISTHPSNTVSPDLIRATLHLWKECDGFVPTVVCVDYADLMVANEGSTRKDFRHQTDEVWSSMRGLSLEINGLVLTATQSDAKGYDVEVITRKNFSEDKRKNAHVTGAIGLNQKPEEREAGLQRLNVFLARDAPFNELRTVTVLQCPRLARPFLASFF